MAQRLLDTGEIDRGVIAVNREQEGMHQPNDNYTILATLKADGTVEKTVICSIVEDLLLTGPGTEDFEILKEYFWAGWLRYLMGLDDEGRPFDLSDDPMLETVRPYAAGLKLEPDQDVEAAVGPILRMENIFGLDLYEAGLAGAVTGYLKELTAGPGAIRATLKKYVHC